MTDFAALLRELAIPRLVGTPNHQQVREILKRELVARGMTVEEHAFSGHPARALLGTPGVIHGVNLIARRHVRPSVWLVAHYDSKGQPISMALRLAGAIALAAGVVALFVQLLPAVALIALGLAVLMQNRVTNTSPGAIDNASALITVFMTLDRLGVSPDVGAIFPDAEEMGLVGARALAAERAEALAGAAIVNLDGIDDIGRPVAFIHRAGPVSDAIVRVLSASASRWLPVVVDGMALRTAGGAGECVTILKGGWRTMRLVHRPGDSADRLTLEGAKQVSAGLARALSEA